MDKARSGGHNIYNVCSGQATSILDLIAALSQAVGTPMNIAFAASRAGEIQVSLGDPEAAAHELGFRSSTNLVTGLAETIASEKNSTPNPDQFGSAFVRQEKSHDLDR